MWFDGQTTERLLLLADLWADSNPASDERVTVAVGAVIPEDLFVASEPEAPLKHASEVERLSMRHRDQAGWDVYGRD